MIRKLAEKSFVAFSMWTANNGSFWRCFAMICVAAALITPSVQNLESFFRDRRKVCNYYEWKCASGQCIESHRLCDGVVDCKDKSDETSGSCAFIRCPSYAFRCQYGGCVDGNAMCNGVKECADSSDEHLHCPGYSEALITQGNCSNTEFQCQSGQCISSDGVCDGMSNCDDGSDEQQRICSLIFCPSFSFRCSYGACIGGYSKCDGVVDCRDGSDEDELLCGKPSPVTTPRIVSTSTTTSTTTTTPAPVEGPPGSCLVPPKPLNGRIVLDETAQNILINSGEFIENFNSVFVICDDKYTIKGAATIICVDGIWLDPFPICERYCSEIPINGITVQPTCEYQRRQVTCKRPLPPSTKARIDCKVGYQKPTGPINETLTCIDGTWDSPVFHCEPVCGTPTPDAEAYIIGGRNASIAEVPWHAGIYRNLDNDTQDDLKSEDWNYICGGTILTERLVVSAAHCFWDVTTFHDVRSFVITVGKYRRDLNTIEKLPAQVLRVRELVTQPQYQDFSGYYNLDIAIIVLSDFIVFKSYVRPICLERNLRTESEKRIKPNSLGRVAGWGLTTSGGELSPNLKVVDIETVDYYTCRDFSPVSYRPFLTGDKFCAGDPKTGTSVCQGDSGGGFALGRDIAGEMVYFLYGVVSSAPRSASGSCDNNKYVAFTEVQNYIPMILDAESRFPVI